MAEQASTEGGYLKENTQTTIFVHLMKALATHQEPIFKECSAIETVKNLYPHEEYRRIVTGVNNRANYWVHKCFTMNFESIDQLCSHVKTPCEPTPPFLKASYCLNSYAKGKEWSAAFAATCLVYAENYGISNLQESHLNEILRLSGLRCRALTIGAEFYEEFYVCPMRATGSFSCSKPSINANLTIQSDDDDDLKGNISFPKGSSELLEALNVFIDSDSLYAIITFDRQSLALVKQKEAEDSNKYLFIFYPQPTDAKGKVTLESRPGSVACLKRFRKESLEEVCKDICLNFFLPAGNTDSENYTKQKSLSTPFKITLVMVSMQEYENL